ncbi:hypothetical protein G7Y89_g11890 [Cudoniella acicularis]|uniref:Uncharacterized protein n=1 Tax=Cudoniella acicularis TaxID=354080 RepID=A0A8H4RA01_9HELO|nr:hypothetical protein G7Y89_g11890 [Cudoniella acicularis]
MNIINLLFKPLDDLSWTYEDRDKSHVIWHPDPDTLILTTHLISPTGRPYHKIVPHRPAPRNILPPKPTSPLPRLHPLKMGRPPLLPSLPTNIRLSSNNYHHKTSQYRSRDCSRGLQ